MQIANHSKIKCPLMNLIFITMLITCALNIQQVEAGELPTNSAQNNKTVTSPKLILDIRPSDLTSSEQSLIEVAVKGDAEAQVKLGLSYLSGEGGYLDYSEAFRWLKLAAFQGNAVAQEYLGTMYAEGLGVMRNKVRAVAFLTLGAESGRASAAIALEGVSKGMTTAQLADARKMANECKVTKFKNCF